MKIDGSLYVCMCTISSGYPCFDMMLLIQLLGTYFSFKCKVIKHVYFPCSNVYTSLRAKWKHFTAFMPSETLPSVFVKGERFYCY